MAIQRECRLAFLQNVTENADFGSLMLVNVKWSTHPDMCDHQDTGKQGP